MNGVDKCTCFDMECSSLEMDGFIHHYKRHLVAPWCPVHGEPEKAQRVQAAKEEARAIAAQSRKP